MGIVKVGRNVDGCHLRRFGPLGYQNGLPSEPNGCELKSRPWIIPCEHQTGQRIIEKHHFSVFGERLLRLPWWSSSGARAGMQSQRHTMQRIMLSLQHWMELRLDLIGTGLLHLAGIASGFATRLPRGELLVRGCGGVISVIGLTYLVG